VRLSQEDFDLYKRGKRESMVLIYSARKIAKEPASIAIMLLVKRIVH